MTLTVPHSQTSRQATPHTIQAIIGDRRQEALTAARQEALAEDIPVASAEEAVLADHSETADEDRQEKKKS